MQNSFEIKKVNASQVISDVDLIKEAVALQLTVGHVRRMLDIKSDVLHALTIRNFYGKCNRLEKAIPEQFSDEQGQWIESHLNARLAGLLNSILDKSQSITPINVVSMVIMANQRGTCTTDFIGGESPTFVVATKKDVSKLVVVNSLGYISTKVMHVLEEMGAERISPAAPEVINFAIAAGTLGEFNKDDNMWAPKKVVSDRVEMGRSFRQGIVVTDGAAYMSQMLKWKPAPMMEIVNMVLSKSSALSKHFKTIAKPVHRGVPLDKLGGYVEEINRASIYSRSLNSLHAYYQTIASSIGKKRTLFKMSDTGAREINASLKWSFALSFYSGSPWARVGDGFVEHQMRNLGKCAYWGAAGNRARQSFDNRFHVSAFDKKESVVYSSKFSEEVLREMKLANWVEQDVLLFQEHHSYEVFASDVFMKSWSSTGRDPQGHHYVSGILKGKLMDVTVELKAKLPVTRFVKGFIPEAEQIELYKGAYPFVLFNCCRPMTTELIYLKMEKLTKDSFDKFAERLSKAYGFDVAAMEYKKMPEGYRGPAQLMRWPEVTWIEDEKMFAEACRQLMVFRCQEMNWLVRKLTLDFQVSVGSPLNRRIWLYRKDMPNLHVLKKFSLTATDSASVYSGVFSAMFGIEDFAGDDDFVNEAIEENRQAEEFHVQHVIQPIGLDELANDVPYERQI